MGLGGPQGQQLNHGGTAERTVEGAEGAHLVEGAGGVPLVEALEIFDGVDVVVDTDLEDHKRFPHIDRGYFPSS